MNITWVDIRWMLVHTTSALPYIVIMCYLLWVHIRAVREAPRAGLGATVTALACTLLAVGVFIFNQPPFRFMVSPATNGYVKDLVLVVQAALVTIFVDQVRDQQKHGAWALRLLAVSAPAIHTTYFYITGATVRDDVFQVPLTVTGYAVACYLYAIVGFALEYRRSSIFSVRWRLGTMVFGLSANVVYILGRGVMGFVPAPLLHGDELVWGVAVGGALVWINRLALTLATVFLTLGLALPAWYRKLGAWVHLLRQAGQHFDRLIALLGRITDQEIKLKDQDRLAVRTVASWLACEMGLSAESRLMVRHLAMLTPFEGAASDRPLPPDSYSHEVRLDLAVSVGVFSAVCQVLEAGPSVVNQHHPEAMVVRAAQWYVEGRPFEEIAASCSGTVAGLLRELCPAQSQAG